MMSAESALLSSLASLDLTPLPTLPLSDEVYISLAGTIAEELDEPTRFLNIPGVAIPLPAFKERLENCVRSLGYTGAMRDRVAVLNFLTGALHAFRILRRRHARSSVALPSTPDELLAHEVSRLCAALRMPPAEPHDLTTCTELANVLATANNMVASALPDPPGPALGPFLLDPPAAASLSTSQRAQCDQIAAQLEREFALRKGMLENRLAVTVQAFQRSERADATGSHFEALKRAARLDDSPVTVHDALAARDHILESVRVSARGARDADAAAGVKQLVMGKVPDRGGRVGAAAAAAGEMPQFRERVQGAPRHGRPGKGGGGASKSRGGKRRKGG